jgi:hypothetical protein
MYLSVLNGIAFYHIHKTGGTSFRRFFSATFPDAVKVADWPHYSLAHYFTILSDTNIDPTKLRILTTIRNPYDHVVSIYHYWRTKARKDDRREHITMSFTSL